MLTLLSIGRYRTQVPYDDTLSILSNARQLLPNIDSSHIKSGNVNIAHLRTYLTVVANREDDITIARTFILFMMEHLWFQTANDTVPLGYLAAAADLESAAQYDWGSAILASLYYGLDTAVTTGGAITGFFQLLTGWSPYSQGRGKVLSLFVPQSIDSTVSEIEDILTAKLLSRKRMPLQVPNGNCKYYLGDRCWRQLEGDADVSLDPPLKSAQDAQRFKEFEDELAIAHRKIDSIDHQLYSHVRTTAEEEV
ncbi:hypothetical protein GIB67_010167 [Kingdonia uniflora]|uniref:Aminotransferase-like plant mobile domain-containing protein n=1 Tax=Kingdonia uniflora TaxID=39325 RepID=A0A7J7NAN1_9MAGN|nr:hypothetical protein GIB67_010167 [Kingdonia uniflora]